MKKLTSILLLLFTFVALTQSFVNASTDEFSTIDKESVSLIDKGFVSFSNVEFSMSNYLSLGFVTLKMGYSTTYSINLTNITTRLNYYNAQNVKNTYLEFDLAAINTGFSSDTHQWLSSDADWNQETKRLDLKGNIPTSKSIEIWWNNGLSGGAPSTTQGGLRVYSIRFVIEYEEPIELYTQITDWSDLPSGTKPFSEFTNTMDDTAQYGQLTNPELVEQDNGSYNIYFDFSPELRYVAKDIFLPQFKNNKEIVYTMYFASTEYRFLWFFFDWNAGNPYASDFVIWNLTTGEFKETLTDTVYGVPRITGNGFSTYNMAYVDLVIPYKLDDILQVTMSYKYRYNYVFGAPGQWNDVYSQNLYSGALSSTKAPWWNPFARLYYNWNPISQLVGIDKLWDYEQIEIITSEYTSEKKIAFVEYLNNKMQLSLVPTQVFTPQSTVGRIFLGQFDKLGSNGVEIKDIVLMNIRYVYEGVEYSKPYPPQLIADSPEIKEPVDIFSEFLDKLWSFVLKFMIPFFIVVSLLVSKVLTSILPRKYSRDPKWYWLIAIGIFIFIYMRFR